MNNSIILDKDSFGVLADFLSDDLQFLLFLKTFDIRPKDKEINWDILDWENISHQDLTTDFVRGFKSYLNWDIVTNHYLTSWKFIREFKDDIIWDIISSRMKFKNDYEYNFYEEFKDKLNWIKISKWGNMDEHFVVLFEECLDWDILSSVQGLTEYLIRRFSHKINWENLSKNYHIPSILRSELISEYNPQEETDNEEEETDNEEEEENLNENDDQSVIIFSLPSNYNILNNEENDEDSDMEMVD